MSNLLLLSLFHMNLDPPSITVLFEECDVIFSSFKPWFWEGFLFPSEAMKGLCYDAIVLAILCF